MTAREIIQDAKLLVALSAVCWIVAAILFVRNL